MRTATTTPEAAWAPGTAAPPADPILRDVAPGGGVTCGARHASRFPQWRSPGIEGVCCSGIPGSAWGAGAARWCLRFLAAEGCPVPGEGVTAMTATSPQAPQAPPAPATALTLPAGPGGRSPAGRAEDDSRVTAPAGGEPMWVIHRYEDLLEVKSSPAWRMANRCETPLTGAELPGGDPPGHMLGMDGATHRKLRRAI